MNIIIDGYNYFHFLLEKSGDSIPDFERGREKIIDRLAQYRKYKPNTITVVFDGTDSYNLYRSNNSQQGIKVLFSAQGEKADDVIMDIADYGDLIVTADREIRDFVENNGAESITPQEFDAKVTMSLLMGGTVKEDDNDDAYRRPISTKKKGNPKRMSKKERKANKFLHKL
ncbi:MAG: NYN domain-containing protein [Nitrospinae bacterium]|nr:NYN domain-containing protein [Nitrospinota bacterium]